MTAAERTCPTCGNTLAGLRRDARYCSARCRALASRVRRLLGGEMPDGYTSLDDYLAARHQFARAMVDHGDLIRSRVVPCCKECNSIAGSKIFPSIIRRRAYIRERLAARYRRLLASPVWTEDELADVDGRIRESIIANQQRREQIKARIAYRHPWTWAVWKESARLPVSFDQQADESVRDAQRRTGAVS